ncbi:MAG: class II fructose-bisphosphate aldolase [bacterium]|nr:class II fructose-bisphosphate aldolase [bacterium]
MTTNLTLKDILQKAQKEGWATGHFNFSELDQMRAIVEACYEIKSPAIIGLSEGERKHLGLKEAVALRDVMRGEYKVPIFLNADHSKSIEAAKQAVDAGFDSVHIDLSALPFEQNMAGTKEVVEYAKNKFSIFNFQFSIEGELGYLKGESKIQKEKIAVNPEDYTKPEEAVRFVKETGINRLAIVVGNIHGISLDEPSLDIERIKEIRSAVPEEVALVLHAGSGIPDEQIKEAIKAGIANIHINTDIRVAYVEGLKRSLQEKPEEVAVYKIDQQAIDDLKKVVVEKLKLFGATGRT